MGGVLFYVLHETAAQLQVVWHAVALHELVTVIIVIVNRVGGVLVELVVKVLLRIGDVSTAVAREAVRRRASCRLVVTFFFVPAVSHRDVGQVVDRLAVLQRG